MAKVEFNYKGIITIMLCSEKDKMEEICKKYAIKSLLDINNLYFLYSGKKIDLQLEFEQIINKIDKERKIMSILVYEINQENINTNSCKIKSKFPICKECNENIKFDIDDYKIKCSGCKNGHSNIMLINEYIDNQIIDISKIKCKECINNKYTIYNNEIYLCSECKIILCPLCKSKHNKTHHIIDYDLKDNICLKHNEIYISYCNVCKINICLKCLKDHKSHKTILYSDIIPDKNELLNKLNDFRNTINIFNESIKVIVNKFNNIKENIEILYSIYHDMINNYEDKHRNYEILMSLNSIKNNNIIKELNNINQTDNINKKFESILNIYDKINYNEITMIYNINNIGKSKIKILGKKFVEKNKNLCRIIYKNKEYELTEEFNIKNINKDKL